jgi:hypothetical protein
MPNLKIGALAERTGTNAPTIRYYAWSLADYLLSSPSN